MPTILVKSEYPDGQVVLVQVSGPLSYPDSLDQLRATAKAALHDAVVELREWDDADELEEPEP